MLFSLKCIINILSMNIPRLAIFLDKIAVDSFITKTCPCYMSLLFGLEKKNIVEKLMETGTEIL